MTHNSNRQAVKEWGILLGVVVAIFTFVYVLCRPVYLTSSMRAPIARVDSDLRTLRTGIESYQVEYNGTLPRNLHCMTTPVAFLQTIPKSPYGAGPYYSYYHENSNTPGTSSLYLFWCMGPDEKFDLNQNLLSQRIKDERERVHNRISEDSIELLFYDLAFNASNGTKSSGDVFRVGVGKRLPLRHRPEVDEKK